MGEFVSFFNEQCCKSGARVIDEPNLLRRGGGNWRNSKFYGRFIFITDNDLG
jgi:hypothetical protein